MMPSEFATFLPICAIGFVDKFKSLHKRKRAKMRVLKFDLTRPARTHTYTHAYTYLHHHVPRVPLMMKEGLDIHDVRSSSKLNEFLGFVSPQVDARPNVVYSHGAVYGLSIHIT